MIHADAAGTSRSGSRYRCSRYMTTCMILVDTSPYLLATLLCTCLPLEQAELQRLSHAGGVVMLGILSPY